MKINAVTYKILFMAIGIGTLMYMVHGLGIEVIWENIQKTGWWFMPVIGSWLVIYILNALAFKAIIQEPNLPQSNLSFGPVLRLTITGYVINYITPFVALGGEPYRIMELKPTLGLQKASSSVLLYSLMHMFSHVIFWLASILLIFAFVPLAPLMLTGCLIMLMVGLILGFWFMRAYKRGFTVSTFRLLTRLPWVGAKMQSLLANKADTLHEIDDQLRVL